MAGRLTVDEMVSVAVAAPPDSAVYHALTEGWGLTEHLLATMNEQQAGLISLTKRHVRPGVSSDTRPAAPPRINDRDMPVQHIGLDVMTIEQYEQRRKERLTNG